MGSWDDASPGSSHSETRIEVIAGWRQAIELALSDEEIVALTAISRSQTDRRAGSSERGCC